MIYRTKSYDLILRGNLHTYTSLEANFPGILTVTKLVSIHFML